MTEGRTHFARAKLLHYCRTCGFVIVGTCFCGRPNP